MRRVLSLFVGLLCLLVGAAVVAPTASAAAGTGQRPATVSEVVPMYISGFDPAVARAHGYPATRPLNVVGGTCGSSYLFLTARPRALFIQTGFSVIHGVIAYQWAVDVYGPSGFRKTWGGSNGLDSTWDGTATQGNLRPGTYEGLVTSPAWALLDTGVICTSNHPSDTKPVF